MEKKPIREIVSTVMKALTLAMGIAVIVLSCLGQLEVETATIMLGIGLASAGIWLLFPDRNPCGSGHFLKHMHYTCAK